MTKSTKFIVVENAGYEGENDRKEFATADAAWKWAKRTYKSELEDLHVQVAMDKADGSRTYDY